MLKVKIKNIILFVMILICLHLSSNVWLRLPGFISPDAYEDNDLEDAQLTHHKSPKGRPH